jgi:hypothetical protein
MKRKLTAKQLAFLAFKRKLSKDRKWLWKHKRPKMEIGRAKATAESIKVREETNSIIVETVREWPAILTPAQLDEHLLMFPYHRKGKKRRMRRNSLIRRLRTLGVIAYVPADNTWLNLCTLPQSKPSAPSEPNDEGSHQ